MFPCFPVRSCERFGFVMFAALCLGAGTAAHGADNLTTAVRPTEYFFDTYGLEAGLPGVSVNAVCQTRDGYLWVATGGGLARFDGVRFVSFRPIDTPAFHSPLIYCLCETHDGTLWIGTSRGIVQYRDGRFEHLGLEDAEVHTLAEDREGRVWAGTYGRGLYCWEDGRFHHCDDELLKDLEFVFRVFVDSADRVWIGGDSGGLLYFDQGTFHRPEAAPNINDRIQAIAEQPVGTLWFGTRTNGLLRWRDSVLARFGPSDGLIGNEVFDLRAARDGGIWIVSGGLQHLANSSHPAIVTVPNVPREGVFGVYEDRDGSVWLSARERGLMRGGEMPYGLVATHDGALDGSVRSISQDNDENFWLASQSGLMRMTAAGVSTYPLRGQAPADLRPTVVLAAHDGTIWVGTAGPLYAWRNHELRRPYPNLNGIYGLFEDRAGTIWIGTISDGIVKYSDGQFVHVPLTSGRPVVHATSFCQGKDNTIYATTWNSGFVKIAGDRAIAFDRSRGLPTDEVRAIYVDDKNRIWLGFRGLGLGLWDRGRCWDSPAVAQAFANHIAAITEDTRGQLWIGTPAGVMWVSKADLIAVLHGEKDAAALRVAQVNRTLRSAAVWTGPQSVLCITRDRKYLFATREGVLAIDPERLPGRSAPPPVYIERAVVEGRAIEFHDDVTLAPGARNLRLDFTAPSFVEPNQVLFRYRLDGYDPDWVEAKTQRTATYGNLAPGAYTFHVIACNADGIWNPKGAELTIVQRPHFYQTGWFYGCVGVALLGVGVGMHRWSHHRLKRRLELLEAKQATERERRRIAKNLHDDLGASLTEISLSAEALDRKIPVDAKPEMSVLAAQVRGLAGTLDAIVWSANPANDSLDRVSAFVSGVFQQLCRTADIRCRIDVPQPLPAISLSPDERSNLFLAAREAMTNLIKHSGTSEAWLRMKIEDQSFRFCLEDRGCGFDLAEAETRNRNGLGNIRSRVAELGGTVRIDTAPGHATSITIDVPLKRFAS